MKKINWITTSLLALCIASIGGLEARAIKAQPVSATSIFQDHDHDAWNEPPSEYRDAQRRGYQEGIEAARHDFDEHRHADADDHNIYKHPPVDESARKDFRDGFREGYRRAMDHMKYDHDDQPRF